MDDELMDPAECAVYERLLWLGCTTPVDPYDPEDCASVATQAVSALRDAGFLPTPPTTP